MGLVANRDKWGTPEIVGQQIQADPAYRAVIREYLERRAKAPLKPDAQLRLAEWCEQSGLKAQAVTHYNNVLQLDPTREAAWRHLGYKRQGNRWVKPEATAAQKAELERQKRADKQWRPKLERLRDDLENKDASRRAKAAESVADLTDPRAVPMVWAVLGRGSERSQRAALQIFGQIDSPIASGALAALAVFCPLADARGRATETLASRDPREVVGTLIGLIRQPLKYQVLPVGGPGSTGVLYVEGERFNVRRIYESLAIDRSMIATRLFDPSVEFDFWRLQSIAMAYADPYVPRAGATGDGRAVPGDPEDALVIPGNQGRPAMNAGVDLATYLADLTEANATSPGDGPRADRIRLIGRVNQAVQQTLAMDVQAIETVNSQINQINNRVLPVLKRVTGQDLGRCPISGRAGGPTSSATRFRRPGRSPTRRSPRSSALRITSPASRRPASGLAPWFPRSKARGQSSRSRSANGCSRRIPPPAGSPSSRWSPCTAASLRRRSGSTSTARRSWRPEYIASGRPARVGPWHAN